jgi:enamine deaminase RidA (YjgF/YER057c/UK114 family)
MGLRNLIKDSVLRIDLLSAPPTLRTNKQAAYETIFGGILTISLLSLFYYFLYLQLSDMFNKLTISYNQGLTDDVESTSEITEFPFAVSIDGVNLATTPRQFIFLLNQYKVVKSTSGPPTTTKTPLILSQCNASDWESYGSNFQGQFNAFGFGQMLCLQSGQSLSLSGYTGSDTYEYLSLEIQQCNQTIDATCDTSANTNSYMTNYLSTNDYFKVRFYVVDTIVTPSNDDAITRVLEKDIFLAFSDTLGTVGYINMAEF